MASIGLNLGCARLQVSTGVTLRENNLKEIEGGRILDSQGVLVANKRALREQPGLLAVVHELIERLEVHTCCPLSLGYFARPDAIGVLSYYILRSPVHGGHLDDIQRSLYSWKENIHSITGFISCVSDVGRHT